ncbi:MAG TPA: DinB family protein [Thermoanaerobaculaceae bacterium]|nr:DinB family protein [Thermoanaerobaculaceae bacterium]
MSKRSVTVVLGVVLAAAALATAARAASPAPSGVKAEMLMFISDAESKLNQLAEAIPEDKYNWRPGEGVRSCAEVFMHVAGANYGIPSFWGVKPPEGFDFKTYEKSLTSKADIQKALKASFVHVKAALAATSNAELAKPTDLFGMKTTVRGGWMLVLSHAHEHLGQMIAYARMNGVVPPWTAAQNAKEAAELKKKNAASQ